MSSIGILFAFITTLCWATSVFPLTKASKLMPVRSMNVLRLFLASIIVCLGSLLLEGNQFYNLFSEKYYQAWIWLGLSGIIAMSFGDHLSFRMYSILSPKFGSVLSTLSPASALILGIILVNEEMNLVGIIGILITIISVMSISLGKKERNTIPLTGQGSIKKGIFYGVLAACCHGSGLAFAKKGFNLQNEIHQTILPISAAFIRVSCGTIAVIFLAFLNGRLFQIVPIIFKQKNGSFKYILFGTVLGPVIAASTSLISIQHIRVAVAQTIFSLVPIFALIIAHFIYKEKISLRAIVGVLISIVGVFILIWRDTITAWF